MSYTGYKGSDEISGQLLQALADAVGNFQEISARLAAADGDRDKAVSAYMDSATDPQAVKLRAAIESAQTKLRELAEQSVVSETLDEATKAKLAAELETLTVRINKGHDAVKSVAASLSLDPEGVTAALAEIGNPTKSGRGRKPGSAGSTLPRVSVNVKMTSDKEPEKTHEFDSLSKVAAFLNAEVKDLQLAFAEAAGVKHEDIKTVDKPITFNFQAENSRQVWTINTTPKERAKSGPRTKSDEATQAKAAA